MDDKYIDEVFKEICNSDNYYMKQQKDFIKNPTQLTVYRKLVQQKLHEELGLIQKPHSGYLYLTEKGKLVFADGGWISYKEKQKIKQKQDLIYSIRKEVQEELIRKGTIEKFRYDQWGFYLAIAAILISLISLLLK